MSAITNSERPLEIIPEASRRDAASNQIKHFIRSNRLVPGERLPTVRKMSETFEVTRDAVWRALQQLQKEKWLKVLPNKRYTVSKHLYTRILRSIRVTAIFSGETHIYFSGFRRLADALTRECRYHNIDLDIQLLPSARMPTAAIWKKNDFLLVDSDSSSSFLKTFAKFPIPVIGLDANYSDLYRANIVTDHHLGGRIAAEAMLKKGAREAVVFYYAGSENNPRVGPRIQGFSQTWREGGRSVDSIKLVPIQWSWNPFEISLIVQAYLEQTVAKGSYFVTDGRLATSFLEVLAYKRVAVPGTVDLIGYDGAQSGELTYPPMTTIQQDMDRIAVTAVRHIRDISAGSDEINVLERIAPLLISRASH